MAHQIRKTITCYASLIVNYRQPLLRKPIKSCLFPESFRPWTLQRTYFLQKMSSKVFIMLAKNLGWLGRCWGEDDEAAELGVPRGLGRADVTLALLQMHPECVSTRPWPRRCLVCFVTNAPRMYIHAALAT